MSDPPPPTSPMPRDAAPRSTRSSPPIRTAELFHRPQWSRAVEQGLRRQRAIICSPRRAGGAISGLLPLSEMRSPLFGNSLVSVGFGIGGGVARRGSARRRRRSPMRRWALAERQRLLGLELRGGAVPEGSWRAERRRLRQFLSRSAAGRRGDPARRSRSAQRAEVRRAPGFDLELHRRHRRGRARRPLSLLLRDRCAISARRSSRAPCSRRCSTDSARMPTSSPSGRTASRWPACSASTSRGSRHALLGRRHRRGAAMARQRGDLLRADVPGLARAAAPASISAARRSAPALMPSRRIGASSPSRSSMRRAPPTARRRARSIRSNPKYRLQDRRCGSSCRSGSPTVLGPPIARGLG